MLNKRYPETRFSRSGKVRLGIDTPIFLQTRSPLFLLLLGCFPPSSVYVLFISSLDYRIVSKWLVSIYNNHRCYPCLEKNNRVSLHDEMRNSLYLLNLFLYKNPQNVNEYNYLNNSLRKLFLKNIRNERAIIIAPNSNFLI